VVLRRASAAGVRNSVTTELDTAARPGSLSAAALRMRRHRERRRDGLRCTTIELRDSEVTALVRKGLLDADARDDHRAVKSAFYGFLDGVLDCDAIRAGSYVQQVQTD
jgi:hypothetical protein